MSISKIMLRCAEAVRPVLVRCIPQSVLSGMKARVIEKEAKNIASLQFEPYDGTAQDGTAYPDGVNLIGDIRVDTGLGQSMRYVSQILDSAGVDNLIYNYYVPPGMNMTDHSCDDKIEDEIRYGINIFHINASEMSVAYMDLGRQTWDKHYNIGFWLWELEDFPKEWMPALNLIDELWVPSDFENEIFRKLTDKPVVTVPYPVTVETDKNITRDDFGLPEDKFLFLCMYDGGSCAARKNPGKVIESFKKAFGPDEAGVGLVVKLKEGSDDDIAYIKSITEGYDNIYYLDRNMSRTEVNSLMTCVDVYVSLHRAEGFGLPCAEAMIAGTPVIATAWSATTQFMSPESACMVKYDMVELDKDYPPFKKGYRWAEADSSDAAMYMRRLFDDKEFYGIIKDSAKTYARQKLSMSHSAAVVSRRLADIRAGRQKGMRI